MQTENEIIHNIIEALDTEDILDRLNLSSEIFVDKFREEILSDLERFSDVYDEQEFDENIEEVE